MNSILKEPGNPEKVFLVLAGTLILSGLGCMIVGLVIDQHYAARVGFLVNGLGVILMFLLREIGRRLD